MSQIIDYQEELEKCHTMEDITGPDGLIQRVIRDAVEQVMNREMEEHIAEEKEWKVGCPKRDITKNLENILREYSHQCSPNS